REALGPGAGEGEVFEGGTTITHTGAGSESFSLTYSGSVGDIVSLTTTEDLGGGNYGVTSEFSGNGTVTDTSTVVVNSTADTVDATPGDGFCDTGATNAIGAPECTLRAALAEANAAAGVDTIHFNIPTADGGHSAGVWIITAATDLPTISATVDIDGSTQPGFVANSAAAPAALDGTQAIEVRAATNLLTLFDFGGGSAASRLHGLTINSGQRASYVNDSGVTITGSYLGTDASGLVARPGTNTVVTLSSTNAQIGGTDPADRNLIAGHGSDLYVSGDDNVIEGNVFGLNATLTAAVGTQDENISIRGDKNRVGGTTTAAANVIGGAGTGVNVDGGFGNAIIGNVISGNTPSGAGTGIGIDLSPINAPDGVTANDAGDGDSGANDYLNHPVLTSVAESSGTLTVDLDLDAPAGDYRIELFTNPTEGPDPSGSGEGETLRHAETITHTGSGAESFTLTFAGSAADHLTATATEDRGSGVYGSTSEFSPALTSPLTVNSTGDGVDVSLGDGVCDTGGTVGSDPECTLRAAIEEANATAYPDTILFDIPTADANHSGGVWTITLASGLPTITDPVTIDGSSQSGYTTTPIISVDGASLPGTTTDGLQLTTGSDGSTIQALALGDFPGNVLEIEGGDDYLIVGNHLGTDAAGTSAVHDASSAVVFVEQGTNITIGGTTSANGNLIAGGSNGIVIDGTDGVDGVTIQGNRIGTDVTGNVDLSTTFDGIRAEDGALNVVIGGSAAGAGNVIGGTGGQGIQISGETTDGVVIEGNSIGVGLDGITALSIGDEGLLVFGGGDNISIIDNVIGNTGEAGIEFDGDSVGGTIQGNRVGLDASDNPHPISQHGILLDDGAGNPTGILVGGTGAGDGNIIANAGSGSSNDGIRQFSTGTNTFLGNLILNSGGLAIDLDVNGVTTNDAGDVDTGPNGLLNFPVITGIAESGGTLTVDYDLDAPAGDYRIEFFTTTVADPSSHGEAEVFADAATITHTGSGAESFSTSFTGARADVIAATATEDLGGGNYGGTSELSASASIIVTVNSTDDVTDNDPGDGVCQTGSTNADGDPECTLRAAIAEAKASA
ncbi:MAG: CSLREA domain-containing protein, partial [Actinomycetota bacterium]